MLLLGKNLLLKWISKLYKSKLIVEWKVSLKKNLEIASRAVYLEGKCSESLADADFTSPETPFLFQLEKTMLDLSSPSLTDGEFYCSFFKLDDVYYCRFFESGVLQGYFLSEGMLHYCSYLHVPCKFIRSDLHNCP